MRRLYGVEAITSDILLATQWDSFKKKRQIQVRERIKSMTYQK
jgi:hypothetical protein